jgi:hypothetical protein
MRLDSTHAIRHYQLLMFPTNRETCFSLNAIPTGMKTFDSCTVCDSDAPLAADCARIGNGTRRELLGFYARVGEFSKVLIERGHWRVFGRSGCRYQAVHEMNLRFSIAVQGVEMNCRLVDLNTRTGDKGAKRRSDVST